MVENGSIIMISITAQKFTLLVYLRQSIFFTDLNTAQSSALHSVLKFNSHRKGIKEKNGAHISEK